jgi:hypothetical protein
MLVFQVEKAHIGEEEHGVDPVKSLAGGITIKNIFWQALKTSVTEVASVQI